MMAADYFYCRTVFKAYLISFVINFTFCMQNENDAAIVKCNFQIFIPLHSCGKMVIA